MSKKFFTLFSLSCLLLLIFNSSTIVCFMISLFFDFSKNNCFLWFFNNFVTPSVWEHVDGSSAIEAGFSQKSAGA